ncbi:SYNERG-CTERM sorting domain-containing protein [Cloacibacillus porcorum]|uniref:Synerg-CTERM sorting domain-containing protein n=1 Tax=Cloacibacillus porcorum TaxID=1197717 RepID=UPI001459292A|nr:Synerg-CTERM sorting domain-containing protein [Cloacibacillus porcorum]MCC8185815.1 SYNERG-CTERM sorting domain-containing protein [Cloacibacillus porcorum]MDY5389956.1 Synerg-CTERM sorting domain-containing protein [Cloacibacillus porcorum]NMF17952.1 SYNERG-CTERM sorting domain-containing protein [Cloacibacillus porcorum]
MLSGDHAWDTDDAAKSPVKIDLKGYTLTLKTKSATSNTGVISGDGVTVTSTSGDINATISGDTTGVIYGAKLIENFDLVDNTYLWAIGAKKEAVEGASTDLTVKNVKTNDPTDGNWKRKQFKIVGGGWNTAVDLSSATVTVEDSIVGHSVYGGSVITFSGTTGVSVDKTLVNINSGAKVVRSVYGGGESRKADTISTVGQSHIIVNKGALIPGTYLLGSEGDKPTEKGYVYGGGNAEGGVCHVKNAIIEIKGGRVAHVRGGGRIEETTGVSSVDVAEIRLIGDEGLNAVSDVKAGGEAASGDATLVGSATIELRDITKAPAVEKVKIDGSGTEKGTTLKFTRVKADLSALTISSMDILVVDSGSKVTINDLGGAKTIMVTGDFNKMPATNILTIKNAAIAAKVDVIIAADNLKEYKWDNGSLMVMGRDSGVAEPVKPELPKDTPAEVKPVEAKIYAVAPDATDAEKNNVIRDASEKLEGISSGDLVVDASGAITVKAETVRNAASSLVAYNETITKVGPLPVFNAEVAKAQTAAVAYKIKGKDLYATDPSKINVIKYLGSGEAARFVYAAAAADFADESYTVMLHGTSTIADSIAADTEYDLVLFIKDGGRFDLDKADAFVADPPAVVQTEKKASGGSSSGCNGGFGALLLLGAAMLPLVYRKKR